MKFHFLKQLFYKNYSLDSRSLVLFRIYIALVLLVNFLFTRLPYFELLHSEKGFFPLKDVILYGNFISKTSSLNFIYAGDGFQIFLFGLAILCAVFLLIGYCTRWALFGSWILLASLHAKNSLIIHSGDMLLVLILFWSLLLPLNSHLALDKVGQKKIKPFNEYSIASFCLIGQILILYIFAWALKTGVTWKDGSFVYYVLMMDIFRTGWGDILLQYPQVMKISTHLTYYFFEMSVPWLFILFGWMWRVRIILICLMIGFHLSLDLFMELGLFSWVCISIWLVLLPSEFWDRLNKYLSIIQKIPIVSTLWDKVYSHIVCHKVLLDRILLASFRQSSVSSAPPPYNYFHKMLFKILSIFFGFCFLYVLAWNVRGLNYQEYSKYFPTSWDDPGKIFHLHQHWGMFSATHKKNYWIILSATPERPKINHPLEPEISKQCPMEQKAIKIDLWQGGKPVTMNKPHRYNDTFPGFRHRKLINHLISLENKLHRKKYLQYQCRKWNKKHPDNKIKDIEFIYMEVVIPPPGGQAGYPKAHNMEKVKCQL